MSVGTHQNDPVVRGPVLICSPVNAHIGNQVRLMRMAKGLSREDLSSSLGITVAQMEKYESGTNRINASRLVELSKALDVLPSTFFEGPKMADSALRESARPDRERHFSRPNETLELLQAFVMIRDPASRAKIVALAKDFAADL